MISGKQPKTINKIDTYREKIQELFIQDNELVLDPERILLALLKDYLKQKPDNFFAIRLKQKMKGENFDLMHALEQYCVNREKNKVTKIKNMDALLIAYFYYFADYYAYSYDSIYLEQFPILKKTILDPLKLYKDSEKHTAFIHLLTDLGSNTYFVQYQRFKILSQNSQVPSKYIPELIDAITKFLGSDKTYFPNHYPQTAYYPLLYPLLFNYELNANGIRDTPLSLRFPLTNNQAYVIAKNLVKHFTGNCGQEVIQALFIITPEEHWREILLQLFDQLENHPKTLSYILNTKIQDAKDQSLVDSVIQRMLPFLNDPCDFKQYCARSSLLDSRYVPARYHHEIIEQILDHDPNFRFSKDRGYNFHDVISSTEILVKIKTVILQRIEAKKIAIFVAIPPLADKLGQDKEILAALRAFIRDLSQPCVYTWEVIDAIEALAALPLDEASRHSVIYEVLTYVPFATLINFYLHPDDTRKPVFELLCKTEYDYIQFIDYFVERLTDPDKRKNVLLILSKMTFPDTLKERIKTIYLSLLAEQPALWCAIAHALYALKPANLESVYLTDKLLENMHNKFACQMIPLLYLQNDRQDEIINSLLDCTQDNDFGIKCEAYAALAKIPHLILDAKELLAILEDLHSGIVGQWQLLSTVHVNHMTEDLLDQMLLFIIKEEPHIEVVSAVIMNLTPPAMKSHVTQRLMDLILKYPRIESLSHALSQFNLTQHDTITFTGKFLAKIKPKFDCHFQLIRHLMAKLPFSGQIAMITVLKTYLDKDCGSYPSCKLFIDQLQNDYIDVPLQIRNISYKRHEIPKLPQELLEDISFKTHRM